MAEERTSMEHAFDEADKIGADAVEIVYNSYSALSGNAFHWVGLIGVLFDKAAEYKLSGNVELSECYDRLYKLADEVMLDPDHFSDEELLFFAADN